MSALRCFCARDVLCVSLCALLVRPLPVVASPPNFGDMSIEQLMNESVTSVSRKEIQLNKSPAAIAVVTQEDLRRQGAANLAEALRFVPGLDVARISSSQWAISARGFNFAYENKLLVLMDGRSIYTPVFGGVFWDVADTDMADLDRIEVVRGPGATLWGANAVNGVINVISKSARETQGTLVSASAGTLDGAAASVRVGGRLGQNFFYRAYVKSFEHGGTVDAAGNDAEDAWSSSRVGFRIDGDVSPTDTLTWQGDYYRANTHQHVQDVLLAPPFTRERLANSHDHGGNLLGRWTHRYSATSTLAVQSYLDHALHSDGSISPDEDNADLDVQHRFAAGERHDVVWGFGYRRHADTIRSSSLVVWTPEERATRLATAFAQDEIQLGPRDLSVIVGSKFEYDYSGGIKTQPSAKILWTRSPSETFWASASRAFKTPARHDTDARVNFVPFQPPGSLPIQLALVGSPSVRVEEVHAYELGYRVQPARQWAIDAAAFYNVYHDLLSYTAGAPRVEAGAGPTHLLIPLVGGNAQSAYSFGTEVAVQWRPADHWHVAADYTWLQTDVQPNRDQEGDNPKHQVHLRSSVELSPAWELNTAFSYVGALTNSASDHHVPRYLRCDVGLTWRATASCEASVFVQNLFDSRHEEYTPLSTAFRGEIPRSISARATWRF